MNSQAARFFLYEKWFKSWKKAEKKGKIKRKKLQKKFCLGASTWREEMPLIKVAYFMLNFLNLKSFLRHLFFWVASCLSTLCTGSSLSLEIRYRIGWRSLIFVSPIFKKKLEHLSLFCFSKHIKAFQTWPQIKWVNFL